MTDEKKQCEKVQDPEDPFFDPIPSSSGVQTRAQTQKKHNQKQQQQPHVQQQQLFQQQQQQLFQQQQLYHQQQHAQNMQSSVPIIINNVNLTPRMKSPEETLDQFLTYFEWITNINKYDDSMKLNTFKALLPYGSSEYNTVQALEKSGPRTFEQLIDELKKEKVPMRDQQVREYYLGRRKNESLDDLANRVIRGWLDLYGDIHDIRELKAMCIRDRFLTMLNEKLADKLRGRTDIETIDEVKAVAKLFESSYQYRADDGPNNNGRNSNNNRRNKSKYCSHCKKNSHNTTECWSLKKGSNQSLASGKSGNNNKNKDKHKAVYELRALSMPRVCLPALINKKTVFCLLDSGARVSVFPKSWPIDRRIKTVATAVNNTKLNVLGESAISMSIDNCNIKHDVLIADVPSPILGWDFFKKNDVTITSDEYMYYSFNGKRRRIKLVNEDEISDDKRSKISGINFKSRGRVFKNGQGESGDQDLRVNKVSNGYRGKVHVIIDVSPFEATSKRPPKLAIDRDPQRRVARVANDDHVQRYYDRMKNNPDLRKKAKHPAKPAKTERRGRHRKGGVMGKCSTMAMTTNAHAP